MKLSQPQPPPQSLNPRTVYAMPPEYPGRPSAPVRASHGTTATVTVQK